MTLDGFLTFLTLAVAIYALLPPVAKIRAKLGAWIQVPVAISALALVLYLEFFELIGQPCPAALGRTCDWLEFPADEAITPPQVAFLVVLVWLVIAWAIHHLSRPGAGSLPLISRVLDDLVYEKDFAKALKLVEPSLPLIGRAAKRRLTLQSVHDRLAVLKGNDPQLTLKLSDFDWGELEREANRNPVARFARKAVGCLSWFVPTQRRAENAAEDIARVLFKSTELRTFVAQMRPYFAIPLLQVDLYGKHDFSDAYFTALISDTGSVLYQEMKQNQNTSSQSGYHFPESNRLLHFLFADPEIAKNLSVWKSVGDHLLKLLRPDGSSDFISYLNSRADNFDDERWENPIYAGIFFFDLMVRAAAHKGVEWHMWLYYFPIIVERLVEIYDTSNPSVDATDEFPTRSARLIYEAMDTLGNWVGLVSDLPEGAHHRQIQPGAHGDNGNIPVSAAMALGSCMATIAMSDRIGDTFAGYMHEVILRDIRDLSREGDAGSLRTFLIQSVVRGGQRNVDFAYGRRLATFWGMVDHVLCSDLDDYRATLNAEYPGVLPSGGI